MTSRRVARASRMAIAVLGGLLAAGVLTALLADFTSASEGPLFATLAVLSIVLGFAILRMRSRAYPVDSETTRRWLRGEDRLGATEPSARAYRPPEPPSSSATAPRLRFAVPDGLPLRALRRGTAAALAEARDALPQRGKVRASAEVEDVDGPDSVVTVRLTIVGDAVDGRAVVAARDAFQRAFLARVEGSALHGGSER